MIVSLLAVKTWLVQGFNLIDINSWASPEFQATSGYSIHGDLDCSYPMVQSMWLNQTDQITHGDPH